MKEEKGYMVTKGFPLYPETIEALEELKKKLNTTWDEVFRYLLNKEEATK